MQLENKYLQIQGTVEKNTLQEFIGDRKYNKPNTFWFFVDYAPATYKLHSKFDIVLEGEDLRMLPQIFNIRLLTVLDQFGNQLDAIQQGWKTICRFEFIEGIPKKVHSLPPLETWKYNKNSLKIAHHNDLFIETNTPGKTAYAKVINDLVFYTLNTDAINQKDFLTAVLKIYAANKEEMNDKVPSGLFSEVERQLQTISHGH